MRVLVIGGGGYIGVQLCARLVAGAHTVTVVDPLWYGDHFDYDVAIRRESSFRLSVDDFRDFDAVVHLAALSNDPMAEYDPGNNFVLNQSSVTHAAFLARRAGVPRFVYASTCSVYGDSQDRICDESSPVDCSSAYAASKYFGEQALLALSTDEFTVLTLRMGTVSGYSRRMRFDLLLNTMVMRALHAGTVTVGAPAAWRPLLGMRDAVSAYESALSVPSPSSGVFNVGSVNLQVLEAAQAVQQAMLDMMGTSVEIEVLDRVDLRSYRADWTKARDHLSFEPTETLPSVIQDILIQQAQYHDLTAVRYYNIQAINTLAAGILV
jgi:nucleoside-diphosphate-sugar epimerase